MATTNADPEDDWESAWDAGKIAPATTVAKPKAEKATDLTEGLAQLSIKTKSGSPQPAASDQAKTRPVNDDVSFDRVVEAYGFPAEMKAAELTRELAPLVPHAGQYSLKWVDSTHALLTFATAAAAEGAVANCCSEVLRLRPWAYASVQAKEALGDTVPQRPQTTAVVARRLVTGALGIRAPPRSQEAAEKDRRVLAEARERREQNRKNKANGAATAAASESAWDS
eukprot:Opistho-1_new@33475